jgi:hypothetical protein
MSLPASRKIESLVRDIRNVIVPSRRAAFRNWCRPRPLPEPARTGVIDIRGTTACVDAGRYLDALIADIEGAGLEPVLIGHRHMLTTFACSAAGRRRQGTPPSVCMPSGHRPASSLLLTDDHSTTARGSTAVGLLDLSLRRARQDEVSFPFPVHPSQRGVGVTPDLDAPRCVDVLFAGNADVPTYDRPILGDRFGVLTRHAALQAAYRWFGADTLRPESGAGWHLGAPRTRFVAFESATSPIPASDWLPTLRRADFFLALPGAHMPMCHNAVEALSAGTIPILEYAQYFRPALRDGIECLAFRGIDGLHAALARAEALGPDGRSAMRHAARRYYDEFLAPGNLTRRVLAAGCSTVVLWDWQVPRAPAAAGC